MAKRKKQSSNVKKVKGAAARPKAKASRGKAAAKRTARAKPKRAPVKKAAPKEVRRMKQPAAPAVDTVAVEVIAPTPCVTIICGRYSTDTRT
jgi:hypothetical protein